MYVYLYVVWKAATSATMLMVNDLTRYKAATLPLHIRYISAFSAGKCVGFTQRPFELAGRVTLDFSFWALAFRITLGYEPA